MSVRASARATGILTFSRSLLCSFARSTTALHRREVVVDRFVRHVVQRTTGYSSGGLQAVAHTLGNTQAGVACVFIRFCHLTVSCLSRRKMRHLQKGVYARK